MTAKKGDKVKVDYTGRLINEVIFDSTEIRGPIEFEIGKGDLIPMFEEAVIGMAEGEKKIISIDPLNGYGEYSDDLFFELEKDRIPENISVDVGTPLQFVEENGQAVVYKVKEIKEETLLIDANHPLAGQNLIFEITLVEIKKTLFLQ
jgi:FKBP-type peptidyl-prolyl cis-trans isomerase 2